MAALIIKACRRRAGWLVTMVVCACVWGIASAQMQRRLSPDASIDPDIRTPDLRDLLAQFQSISSLQFEALVEASSSIAFCPCDPDPVWIDPDARQAPKPREIAVGVPIQGRMEYSAAGDAYKIVSFMDPSGYPGMDTQFAYDGQHFQMLHPGGRLLTYSAQDNATLLMTLPNPVLELIQFRYPESDENYATRLRLKDVIMDQTADEFWNVVWIEVAEEGRRLERAEFPGGTYEGREYVHHVFTAPGARNKPLRIDRVTDDGILTSTEFSHYLEVGTDDGPTFWPQHMVLRAFDEGGAEVAMLSYIITRFSLNAPVARESFALSTVGVDRVWNDDGEQFVSDKP